MKRVEMPSPNKDSRGSAAVNMLVLHYTGMTSGRAALERLCDPAAKVSSHYTIDEDGTVYAHVPESERAWHSGVSYWMGTNNVNACSIGIELVNPGHEFGYREFAAAQIASLIQLCQDIKTRHAIPAHRVLGHSDVAPERKDDPGELFPWEALAKAGIGLWPEDLEGYYPASYLVRFGYNPEAPRERQVRAFQRHFRPAQLTGQWDEECGARLAALLAKTPPPAL